MILACRELPRPLTGATVSSEGSPLSRARKLQTLLLLARSRPGDPALQLLIGFLAGRLDQVRFVRELAGWEVALHLMDPGRLLWPGRPFRGRVGEVEVPDPVTMISALLERGDPIAVRIDFTDPPPWYDELLEAAAEPAGEPGEDRVEVLRRRVDQALDIFNECRRALAAGAREREGELQFLLELARSEVAELSRELQRLQATPPAG